MKIILLILALIFPVNAFAGDIRPYVSVGSGITIPSNLTGEIEGREEEMDLDAGYKVGFALGAEKGNFRVETEFTYREATLGDLSYGKHELAADGNVNSKALMFNGFFNLVDLEYLSPYIGAGVGISWEKGEIHKLQGDKLKRIKGQTYGKSDGFAFQFMGGFTAPFTDRLVSDIEYRYFEGDEFSAHEMGANLRYMF